MASNPTNTAAPTGGLTEKKHDRRSTSSESVSGTGFAEHADRTGTFNQNARLEASKKIANPLAGLSPQRLEAMGEEYAMMAGLTSEEDIRAFRLGARIAGDESNYDLIPELTEREKEECSSMMLTTILQVCSLCAAVQGMDETVVNGAQLFYKDKFGIGTDSQRDTWLLGLVNSAPYLCCALIGCWLTEPMNRIFGRRGTIFVSCIISAVACFHQAFTNTWWHMFIARFYLGLGIGPKSATTPIFAAECSPPKLRGALVMQWQMWTAFGIMVGYIADLAFYFVPDHGIGLGLNWRLMMGSAMIPAVIVVCLAFLCPESPRWYLSKGRHQDAFGALCRLRFEKVQAARDLFYTHTLLEAEKQAMSGVKKGNRFKELFTVRRNRNAVIASSGLMFMQQFCGVNIIAYYSSAVFRDAGFSDVSALAASLGFGVVNWLFAIPAMYTIDTFGRRNLLLTTFPLMSLFLFFTGFSFWIPEDSKAHIGCIALGIYLFGMVYSPGEGPVPFTYSAEAYPLYIRPIGMSLATATTWFFNFILSITWPRMVTAFKPQGAFGWYAGWNIIGFLFTLFLVPETKGKTLEELDHVFDVPLKKLVRYGADQSLWFFHRGKNGNGMRPTAPSAEMYHGDAERMNEVVSGQQLGEGEREKRWNKEQEREGGIMGRGDAAGKV
uniref:Related to myo-inositol transport protein ITR1 n=1 Tax=Neurospora crassa TaxID=5141 RepID=Q9P3B9_NEUCS|nr:related to myo-inositol transport protein ITR1 [Neurospora crassa]